MPRANTVKKTAVKTPARVEPKGSNIISIDGKNPIELTDSVNFNLTIDRIDITPEIAKKFLVQNHPGNRPYRSERVNQYANDMLNGVWRSTGDPIQFDYEDNLINGQHRLMAVIKSGVTLKDILVVRGLPPSAIRVMDQGYKRTLQQNFAMEGKPVSTIEIAVAKFLVVPIGGSESVHMNLGAERIRELIDTYRDGVRFACTYASSSNKTQPVKLAPIRAAIARAYYHVDHEELAQFVQALDTGIMSIRQDRLPVLLRNEYLGLLNRRKLRDKGDRMAVYQSTIFALWKYFDATVEEIEGIKGLRRVKRQYFPIQGLPD